MATLVLKNAIVAYGGRDLSGLTNQIALTVEADLQEDTAMGDTYRSRLGGLKDSRVGINGFWESASASDSADADLFAKLGAAKDLLSLSADGGTFGDVGYSLECDMVNYVPGASIGEVFAFSIELQGNGLMHRGTVMENSTRVVTADGTTLQLGAVSASQSVYSALHVTAASASDTLDVVLESDSTNSFSGSETAQITHTQITAVGSELLSSAGAITDTWWRLTFAIGGSDPSFTIFGVVAIVNNS